MYVWIWRHLPGSPRLRLLQAVLLLAVVVAVCFTWLFPLLAEALRGNGNTVG